MNICVFASGTGTNFNAILESIISGYLKSKISLLITNNSKCGAAEIARRNNIDVVHISRKIFPGLSEKEYTDKFLSALEKHKIDFIVLAGYMKFVAKDIIRQYKKRIINIHPSLLPSFGGKGMFGMNVHSSVIAGGAEVSGITIHFVDEDYDAGEIIFQKSCTVDADDDEFSLQKKILQMEHKYYPEVIKRFESSVLSTGS